jgi:thiosulfate/3-mercaptopyruvate sulfurtransferase
VSVRTWREHIGNVSGYNYIGPAGRIKGDVWGNCGTDAYHMQHYRNVDNTTRAYPEIAANWEAAGVTPDKWVAFYCGTGWRASESWFYAYLLGWERIAVYDGGWRGRESDLSTTDRDRCRRVRPAPDDTPRSLPGGAAGPRGRHLA